MDFIEAHLPWLIGSIGTLVFDFTIFCQFLCFGQGNTVQMRVLLFIITSLAFLSMVASTIATHSLLQKWKKSTLMTSDSHSIVKKGRGSMMINVLI